jgi:RNA polymerase sigma-70 factor (ECF subfamily)
MRWSSRYHPMNSPEDDPPPQRNAVSGEDASLETADMASATAMDNALQAMETGEIERAAAAAPALPPVDVSQFDAIFERFQTPISNFLYRLVGNREQALDLAQDVFVKVYRALAGGTTIQAAALSSWIYRIATNTATDALRRRRLIAWLSLSLFNDDRGIGAGMPSSDGDEGPMAPGLGTAYDGARFEQHVADREAVQHVLAQLPPKYAQCLMLYEYEGFSCAEIADILGVTPSAVKMRLMRAREKFIALYQQEVSEP